MRTIIIHINPSARYRSPYAQLPSSLRTGRYILLSVNTNGRQPVLTEPAVSAALRDAVRETRRALPFIIVAWVVMPNHVHAIWQLPRGDADFSLSWARIKQTVTRVYADLPFARETAAPRAANDVKGCYGNDASGNKSATKSISPGMSSIFITIQSSTATYRGCEIGRVPLFTNTCGRVFIRSNGEMGICRRVRALRE